MKLRNSKRHIEKSGRWPRTLLLLAVGALFVSVTPVQAQKIFSEDFETLPLGPNVDEALVGAKVWTKGPPEGWTADDSGVPGVGVPAEDGMTEWAGWSFANKDWWATTAGNQRRVEFTFAQGTVMIADPDEWDDAFHKQGLFNTTVTTGKISLADQSANTLVLVFDSSWRPEAFDDGLPNFPVGPDGERINNQTGFVTAKFDEATATDVVRWESDSQSPNFKADGEFINESVTIPLNNPAGAQNLVLTFGMEKAANDWWWAVDNIAVGVPPFVGGIAADGVSFSLRIVEALGRTVDTTKPIVLELDGTAVTPTERTQEGDRLVVKYSQSPEIFQPGSRHTTKTTFTSNEGKQITDTAQFIAPSYTTVSSTPFGVTAVIKDTAWLTVDETKGVQLQLDGTTVTATSITRNETTVTVLYSKAEPFASASTHTLSVTFTTDAGKQVTDVSQFTAPAYMTLPSSLGTAIGTGAQRGMRWRTHQLETSRATSISAAEQQLANNALGGLGSSIHDTSSDESDGYVLIDYVNFDQAAGEAGNFKASAEEPQNVEDLFIPGIPGTTGGTDNIAGEALAFVEIPQPGLYTMVVNSDDGFQVSMGTINQPTYLVLGKFDGGRGSADSAFYFQVETAGVYFFRTLWFEGGGGANVEWFTVNSDGSRALVNGTQPGALRTFRTRTVAEPTIPVANNGITSVALTAGNVMIQFTGTLKSSTSVTGPFTPVQGAQSPYQVAPADPARFYIAD